MPRYGCAVPSFLSRTSQLIHKYYSSSNRVNTQATPYEHANNLTRVNSSNTSRWFLFLFAFNRVVLKSVEARLARSYTNIRILLCEYYRHGTVLDPKAESNVTVTGEKVLMVDRCSRSLIAVKVARCRLRVIKYNKYDNTSRMIMNEIKNWKIIKWSDNLPVTLQYRV